MDGTAFVSHTGHQLLFSYKRLLVTAPSLRENRSMREKGYRHYRTDPGSIKLCEKRIPLFLKATALLVMSYIIMYRRRRGTTMSLLLWVLGLARFSCSTACQVMRTVNIRCHLLRISTAFVCRSRDLEKLFLAQAMRLILTFTSEEYNGPGL